MPFEHQPLQRLQAAKPPPPVVAEESPRTDIEALRKRALSLLNASAHHGRLFVALQSVKPRPGIALDSGAATEDVNIDSLRTEAMSILSEAVHDSRVNVALQHVTEAAKAKCTPAEQEVVHLAPAPEVKHLAPAPEVEHFTPAPGVDHLATADTRQWCRTGAGTHQP